MQCLQNSLLQSHADIMNAANHLAPLERRVTVYVLIS